MKKVILPTSEEVVVSNEDFKLIDLFKWHRSGVKGNYSVATFIYVNSMKIKIRIHRLIMNAPKGLVVDHINHNVFDNRRENLRICSQRQNTFNRRPNKKGTSKYKGVRWHKDMKKWESQIRTADKKYSLGYYENEVEAALAFNEKAKKLFGEFAYLNKIQ